MLMTVHAFVHAVAFALRMVIHSRLAAAQQHILDIPTCTARLHALGLDLGEPLRCVPQLCDAHAIAY